MRRKQGNCVLTWALHDVPVPPSISKGATEVIKFGLSIVAAALMSGTAMAADLVIYEPINMADPVVAGNFYASIFGGAALIHQMDYDSTAATGTGGVLNFDTGYSVDAAVGYNFGGGFSLEGQIGYLNAGLTDGTWVQNAPDPVIPFDSEGSASALYGMINAWYGVDLGGITPFIGGGVGVAHVTLDGDFGGPLAASAFEESATTYAVQVGVGAAVSVTEDVDLVARYRYFMTGDVEFIDGLGSTVTGSLSTSIVDVGLKIAF
jgi:opacity protein-like surface antigen